MFSQFDCSLRKCEDLSDKLKSNGYAVIDNLFDNELLASLREELEFLDNSEWLDPSGNKLQHAEGEENRTVVNKPGVYERSIVMKNDLVAGEATLEMVPNISEFYYQRDRLVECMAKNTQLSVSALDQVKLARIQEGGAFMVHTDTTPKKDRVLTMTLYLNSSVKDYNPEVDGGQLRLYPLSGQCVPAIIDVDPVYGRAVLFSSNNLPHRVLPSTSECRFCISFFFYGDSIVPSPHVSASDIENILLSPAKQNIIYDTLKLKCQSDNGEPNEEKLKSYMMRVKQSYPEVLCALIHAREYYMSIAHAFTDVAFDSDGDDFHSVTAQINDEVVRKAVEYFKSKCDSLAQTVDDDLADFVNAAKEHLKGVGCL